MNLSFVAKAMVRTICILMLIFIAASIAFYRSLSCLPFVIGVILGGAVSVLKVYFLDKAVNKALAMEKKTAGNYVRIQYFFRLFVTGAALMAAVIIPGISLWGVAAGIITFQISVFLLKFNKNIEA